MDRRNLLSSALAAAPGLALGDIPQRLTPAAAPCGEVVIDACAFIGSADPATAAGKAIQDALATIGAAGGAVRLLPGTYKLTPQPRLFGSTSIAAGLWIPSNTSISGSGPATVLEIVGSSGGVGMMNSDPQHGNERIVVRDLVVQGRSAADATPPGYFLKVTADQYRHHGVLMMNAKHFTIESVEVRDVWGAGFYFANCGSEYSAARPQEFAGASAGRVANCLAMRCGSYGIWMNGSGTKDILVADCHVESVGKGPVMANSYSPGHGILFDSNVLFCRVDRCRVIQPTGSAVDGHGIFLTIDCSYNQVSGCTINGGPGTGVTVGSGCRNNRIAGCHVQNVESNAYSVSAPPNSGLSGTQLLSCSADAFRGVGCLVNHAPGTQVIGLLIGPHRQSPKPGEGPQPAVMGQDSPGLLVAELTCEAPGTGTPVPAYSVVMDRVSCRQEAAQLETANTIFRGGSGGAMVK